MLSVVAGFSKGILQATGCILLSGLFLNEKLPFAFDKQPKTLPLLA